jgi:hypothetical protein
VLNRSALVDGFFESARWGLGKQIALATGLIFTASAVMGSLASRDAGSRPRTPQRTSAQPAATTSSPLFNATTTVLAAGTVQPAKRTATTVAFETTIPSQEAITTSAARPTSGGSADALELLATIPVQLEHSTGYSRDLFAIWSDINSDGCDTRADVLIAESLTPAQVDPFGCTVVAGDWLSSYDGITTTSPGDLDIDHVVALKEAWDSGAWQWTADRRIAYGNDTTDPRTLTAVSATSNRAKSDKDPSNWLPPDVNAICHFLGDWVSVKARWQLSMDESEWGRIKNQLEERCPGLRIST